MDLSFVEAEARVGAGAGAVGVWIEGCSFLRESMLIAAAVQILVLVLEREHEAKGLTGCR